MNEPEINWHSLDDRYPNYRYLRQSSRLSQQHTDAKIDGLKKDVKNGIKSVRKDVNTRLTQMQLHLVLWIISTGVAIVSASLATLGILLKLR